VSPFGPWVISFQIVKPFWEKRLFYRLNDIEFIKNEDIVSFNPPAEKIS
jgi:hypothetical protein